MKKLLIFTIVLLVISLVGCSNLSDTSSETDTISSQIELISSEIVSSSVEETSSEEVVSSEPPNESTPQPETSEIASTVETISSQTENTVSENKTNEEVDTSNNQDHSNTTSSNIPEYIEHTWAVDDNGNKIEGSDTYITKNGDVYDVNGNFMYNLGDFGFWGN